MTAAARVAPGLVLLAVACASAERPAAEPAEAGMTSARAATAASFELAPGVVVGPSGTLYLARPQGGVEALDPASGRPLWSSDEAARPLFAREGRLLAQRETGAGLPLAVLDALAGELLLSFAAPLPEGVRAAVDESLQARFTLSTRAVGGDVVLEWGYLERDALGVSPPGGRPFARRQRGALRVDPVRGAASAVDPAALPALEGELPPPVERLVTSGELRVPPWRTGEVLAAAQQLYEPSERLVLRRWRAATGEALPEMALAEGRPVAVLPAADRRHLLVVGRPAEPGERAPYRWTIHSLATGETLVQRRAEVSATPFCLLGRALLLLEPPVGRRVEGGWQELPLRLRALGAASGTELWQRAVRDPAFRGPAPPRS